MRSRNVRDANAMTRRRRTEEQMPAADRWMLSWSDFVTLLLALFAAMYAGASIDLAKANAVAQSVGKALGAPPPAAAVPQAPRAQPDLDAMAKELTAALAGLGERVRVLREGDALGIAIDAELLFGEGDARLSAQAGGVLADIARVLGERPYAIRVEGHTDATPIANSRYASNWELSAARAAVVVRRLIACGIAESRLTAIGMAANRPVAGNDAEGGRRLNRRVHLLVIPDA